jgi:hypothetical protein
MIDIEQLAREADLDHAEPDHNCRVPYFDMVTIEELTRFARLIVERCAVECSATHANGNHKHDTREECADAIRALLETK